MPVTDECGICIPTSRKFPDSPVKIYPRNVCHKNTWWSQPPLRYRRRSQGQREQVVSCPKWLDIGIRLGDHKSTPNVIRMLLRWLSDTKKMATRIGAAGKLRQDANHPDGLSSVCLDASLCYNSILWEAFLPSQSIPGMRLPEPNRCK